MKLLAALLVLFFGAVTPLALMPSPQGTHWYAGQRIWIRAMSTSDSDGTAYNLYLKQGKIFEKVYTGAPYNTPISFIVPEAFGANGCGTLYAVAQGSQGTVYDTMNVQILSLYYYNQYYNSDSSVSRWDYNTPYERRHGSHHGGHGGGCTGCRF